MFERGQTGGIYGSEVYDSKGAKLGKVDQVYTGAYSGNPEWVSVKTGLFGMNHSLAPLHGANVEEGRLHLAHDKDTVTDAPNVDANKDEPLSGEDVQRLHDYYRVDQGERLAGGDANRGTPYSGPDLSERTGPDRNNWDGER